MPPKKVAKKRAPKRPVRPPLKIPSKITVKIGSTGSRPPKIEKCISNERKIELANEVALAQLQAQPMSRISQKTAELTTTQANTQKTLKKPIKKFTTLTTDVDSLDDFETTPEPKKKKPGPKSKTMAQTKKIPNLNPLVLVRNKQWEVKGKIAKPITKAKTPQKKKQLKSVADNLSDVISKAETGAQATPPKKPKGRPKGSFKKKPQQTPSTSNTFSAKEIKFAATRVEQALGIASHSPNSVISSRSNLSWTRDISTESSFSSGNTCISATTNDFIRFNNKLPLVHVENCVLPKTNNVTPTCQPPSTMPKVNNVTTQPKLPSVQSKDESSSSDSESSSSSSSSSDSELGGTNTLPELNLSTSSLTSQLPICDTKIDTIGQNIENLTKLLKNFYSEIRKFVPHDDEDPCTFSEIFECVDRELNALPPVHKGVDPDIDAIIDKSDSFDRDLEAMFQETYNPEKPIEYSRISGYTEQNECDTKDGEEIENFRRLSYENNSSEKITPERCRLRQNSVHNDSEVIFAKPTVVRHVSAANSRDTTTNHQEKQLVSNLNRVEASPTDSFKTFTSDNYNYVPFERTEEDEDALSLYAESISGMESSRRNSVASVSNVSQHDVYVPKYSPTSCMREKYVYKPTKIQVLQESNLAEESMVDRKIISNKDDQEQEPGTKSQLSPACVSSSGSRDMKTTSEISEDSNPMLSHDEESIIRTEAQLSSQPRRLFSSYIKMNPIKSSLYRGVCFFNIASQCKNGNCRFPHVILDTNTIKCRLAVLHEDTLIAEYLLMCAYGPLRRNLCILFVEECKRRTATRILFEMVIDLGLGFVEIDEDLRVKVLETALLHLNTISIDACDDLLKFEHKNTMLCDALISCMANSQNFAQFKRAFVKLANLMCELKRPVDIQVVSSILERVCILPGEDVLARGMLTLMKNTDVSIFENSLAWSFEVQLSNIDSDVHEVYLLTKKAVLEGQLAQPDEMYLATSLLSPRHAEVRHTSPDSTNVDKLPMTKETIFKRTINDEAIRNLFKPPANPVPKRFVIPKMSQSSRNRRNGRGSSRGRIASRKPGERWVLGSQMFCRTLTRK